MDARSTKHKIHIRLWVPVCLFVYFAV